MTRRSAKHLAWAAETDHGGGFWTWTEREGAAFWYYAAQLDAPGGYVVAHRIKKFSYARDALAQVEAWKAAD